MPGSVSLASPSTVLPNALCKAYSLSLEYLSVANTYRNGERQVAALTDKERRTWKLVPRLNATKLAALVTFAKARLPHGAFWFYDIANGATYDGTGGTTSGRYTVRFQDGLAITGDVARSDAAFTLIQVP